MKYEKKEAPLQFGIMYTDEIGKQVETIWYETPELRDEAIQVLFEVGEIPAGTLWSNREKIIKPISFSSINAEKSYYLLMKQPQ